MKAPATLSEFLCEASITEPQVHMYQTGREMLDGFIKL